MAEAPGRLGAERTGVPLSGDQAGRNFDALLAEAGLRRESVFITNAVLCNPQAAGANRPPKPAEIANCRDHLAVTIEVVNAPLVAALGSVAWRALDAVAPLAATDYGEAQAWLGRTVVRLAHPGARARVHRPLVQQQEDWARLAVLARGL